ncbi:unnamed protein product [Periconia digitata]|uniref:Uncharacterized protein n=1 Tax=Periconia digitata TaxID=1303443 RepID=A0A9W4U3H9_9PLEO|nr:unnamed protein product [Periconia digitata]
MPLSRIYKPHFSIRNRPFHFSSFFTSSSIAGYVSKTRYNNQRAHKKCAARVISDPSDDRGGWR